ncbi:CPBP family intramembrane glutamic endopeptidase [Methanobrevibacter sp.]|uniref:CPBP family intramembrane glutamic endopeptidase n=1 Tax=Methanobrevibacter sp. TaxID=66852 RepID=UPI0038645973
MNENDNKFPDFVTFGRTFENYKWYKPLLTLIVSMVLFLVFQLILVAVFSIIYGQDIITGIAMGGYETLNKSDAFSYFSYLGIAVFLPALYLSCKIVNYRPFSSYSSSRGGWNLKLYLKCLIIPVIVYVVVTAISIAIGFEKGDGNVHVSAIALVVCLILIPLQCISEEYLFRGILMQTFGSWFKIPIIAIILQSVCFLILHPYNVIGMITIGFSGIVLGLMAWRTSGLEAGSAIHSINNLASFYTVSLGVGSLSSNVTVGSAFEDICATLISALLLYYIGNKKGWFDPKTD